MSAAERTSEASSAVRANERAVRANERADERMTEYSTRRFQPRAHRYETFFVSVVEEIPFFTIWGWHSFPLKPDVRKEIED